MKAPRFLSVKNLEKYQHYKKRSPPWVKIYREILTDYDLISLPVHLRFAHIGLVILASEGANQVPADCQYISTRLGVKVTEQDLTLLIQKKFLLASCKRSARRFASNLSLSDRDRGETETEERRGEGHPPTNGFLPKQRKRSISDEDKPTDKHFSLGKSLNVDVGPEWGKFKNYCLAHDKRYANFEAAFRNWIANAAEYKEKSHVVR